MDLLINIFGERKSAAQKRTDRLMHASSSLLHSIENNLSAFTPKEKVIIVNRLNSLLLESLEIEAKAAEENFSNVSQAINEFQKNHNE
tara:strand:- start:19470 stop:19733 length:264 start_codon:yes stop_codon:yes gene_type:complete